MKIMQMFYENVVGILQMYLIKIHGNIADVFKKILWKYCRCI